MKRSRQFALFFAICECILLLVPASFSPVSAVDYANNNTININPFRSAFKSLSFFDANDDKFLGQKSITEIYEQGDTLWELNSDIDSAHRARQYPKVQMYVTPPFLVDNNGLDVYGDNDTNYVVDPSNMVNTMEKDPVTGAYIYIAKVNIAFDYIVKTVANLDPITYNYYPIDKLVGMSASHTKPTAVPPFVVVISGYDIFATGTVYSGEWGLNRQIPPGETINFRTGVAGNKPYGVLLASWYYDTLVYSTQEPAAWHVKDVGIRNSLTNYKDLTESQRSLSNDFGNRPVKVVAEIEASAFLNPILYEYYREVDGQIFTVRSDEAKIGFYDAKLIPGLDKGGKVPVYIPPASYYTVPQSLVVQSATEAMGRNEDYSNVAATDVPGITTTTTKAWYTCTSTYPAYQPTIGAIPTYTVGKEPGFPVTTTVSASNFEDVMPETMRVTLTDRIQPYTKVHNAIYTGQAVGVKSYYAGDSVLQDVIPVAVSLYDDFPYRAEIENTYVTHRVVLTCFVKTINDILYLPADGAPVDVDDFTDYGINYLGVFNPSLNDAGGSVTQFIANPFKALLDLFAAFGWEIVLILIAAGVISLGIVIVVIGIKKNPKR